MKKDKNTRNELLLYINGQRTVVTGSRAFLPLSSFLRYELAQTGTKVVCAEGDCGACTVLVAFPERAKTHSFRMINSCIAPVYLFDGASLVTVEGLREANQDLHEVQKQMLNHHGSQCGFCTPGFVMALTGMLESGGSVDEQRVKNFTTGNLCRCTGYKPIITAGTAIDSQKVKPLRQRYLTSVIKKDLEATAKTSFRIETEEKVVHGPTSLKEVSRLLAAHRNLKIVSSGTDLGVVYNKEKIDLEHALTLHHIPELFDLKDADGEIFVGAKVDLHLLQRFVKTKIPSFARFLNIFASPQIRNAATLVGNIANGSPIADTLPFLFVTEALVEIQGPRRQRTVPITELYKGYRRLSLEPGEWITGVRIPKPKRGERLFLYKVSQRRDLDISTVNAGFLVKKGPSGIETIRIAYGGVGPTVLRLRETERFLRGRVLQDNIFREARQMIQNEIHPISDLRGSEDFRRKASDGLFRKFCLEEASPS